MKATMEWLVGVVRLGQGHEKLGDEYETSMTVVRIGDEALIKGAVGDMPTTVVKAIADVLIKEGFTSVTWFRKRKGGHKEVSIRLKQGHRGGKMRKKDE